MTNLEEIKSNIHLINIKSYYNIKKIFEFLEDKKALEVIRYNKVIKDILVVDTEHYKHSSEKHKIGGKNGMVKVYTKYNNLIFEGDYINGKKNGKGKEYDCGKLIFEGEYVSGKKNGKGKEYDRWNKALLFEGEYLNGKRNGNGYYSIKELQLLSQEKNQKEKEKELNIIKYKSE